MADMDVFTVWTLVKVYLQVVPYIYLILIHRIFRNKRTNELLRIWASEAESTDEAVYGIKGEAILHAHLGCVDGVSVDYMHAVLEGVTKQITLMWLNSKHHRSSFYIGRHIGLIDKFLLKFKPPAQFPRSITTIKFWKASEFRAWLLLPIIQNILPPENIHHWSLSVFAMQILLGSNITSWM